MENGVFLVEDVNMITGRGIAAIGTVLNGRFNFGDNVIIVRNDGCSCESTVKRTGIISSFDILGFHDRLALFLEGVAIEDIIVGNTIISVSPEMKYESK